MAWLGAIVLLGLGLLALDALREHVGARRQRRRAELGIERQPWSRRRRLVALATGLGFLAVLVGTALWFRGGGGDESATEKLNVLPNDESSTTTTSPSATTTSAQNTTTSPPTTTLDPGRPPQQVRVSVVNSSGVTGAAAQKSGALGALGYQMVGLANGVSRTGTAVQCKPGFEKEALPLARNVGGTTKVEPFPNPPPPEAANADCVVVLGA